MKRTIVHVRMDDDLIRLLKEDAETNTEGSLAMMLRQVVRKHYTQNKTQTHHIKQVDASLFRRINLELRSAGLRTNATKVNSKAIQDFLKEGKTPEDLISHVRQCVELYREKLLSRRDMRLAAMLAIDPALIATPRKEPNPPPKATDSPPPPTPSPQNRQPSTQTNECSCPAEDGYLKFKAEQAKNDGQVADQG